MSIKDRAPIKIKPKNKGELPAGLVSVIYLCSNCGAKNTYGADYFVEVGIPPKCPNCDHPYEQDDQIQRVEADSDEDLLMARDDLRRKRGEDVPVVEKPEDPEKIKQAEIERLENEIKKLKGQNVPGIKLGP
jgi:DNA-directed RNA polymerase subunit RPC12/RpoP